MKSDCPYFEGCSAPLCPEDPKSQADCYWYPDEEICKRRPAPPWVAKQRRLAGRPWEVGYFTVPMLLRLTVTAGLEGLNPDLQREVQERRWLKTHRGRGPREKVPREAVVMAS